ncbi:hypothetical protein Y032_0010g954 [Ancylostoma ceylanicum]|uniref:Uncharacterized protein n=1 Tax=Ancylostoma ceylanicum TaxID=53326 RepID=A0A016VHI7_9BILA|nr:hypothetical protein Y032_0010g954 [Ancylostoma ceylanicum]
MTIDNHRERYYERLPQSTTWTVLCAHDVMPASDKCRILSRRRTSGAKVFRGSILSSASRRLSVRPMTTNLNEPIAIQVDNNDLRRTDYFKYLGSTLLVDGNLADKVVARVNAT